MCYSLAYIRPVHVKRMLKFQRWRHSLLSMYQFHFLYDAIQYEKLPTVYYVNVPRLYTKVLKKNVQTDG